MNKQDFSFVPLLFAGDINVYSMARAFHEAYGICPTVYGKYPSFPCSGSRIMDYRIDQEADRQDTFLRLVNHFSQEHPDKSVLLIGCGDSYVQLISENKDRFRSNVIAPYIPIDQMNELIHKERFYDMCQRIGVDYPDTFIHRKEMGQAFDLPFDGPFIIKPSNGILYWRYPFPTQKKVYKVESRPELVQVLDQIYHSGYDDSIVVQNFIPGDDTYMRVLTNYSDRNGEVKLMCLGHVLLEEHTPHGLGNHAVIVTERNQEVEERFRILLEDMGYVGFSNFDIKYDQRDGKYKVFEINTRQGRSNYYVTGAGANLAQYVVEDWIYNHPIDFRVVDKEQLWMVVPRGVAFRYVKPRHLKEQMRKLVRQGQVVNPLYYDKDRGFSRGLRRFKSQLGHYYKFWKYL